jgi:enterochelin esterase-like enzyme
MLFRNQVPFSDKIKIHAEGNPMITRILAAGLLSLPVFVFSGAELKLPVPPSGWDASSSVPHGQVKTNISYKTTGFGDQLYSIYLPPGYSTAKKYPVLYLFHGLTDDQTTWTNGSKGKANNIIDNLIAQNKVVPMVIVMPDGAMGDNGSTGNFAKLDDPLINNLIPLIESTYSVSTAPIDRAVGGLSMGGGQTLRIGFGHVNMFSWIGAFAAATDTDPAKTIKDVAEVKKNVKYIWLSVGSNDGLKTGTDKFHDYLDQNNINPHGLQHEIGEGHSWTCFNRSLYNYSQRIFTASSTGVKLAMDGRNGKAPKAALVFQSGRLMVQSRDPSGPSARYFLDGRSVTMRDAASLPIIFGQR